MYQPPPPSMMLPGAAITRLRIAAHPSGDVAVYVWLRLRTSYDNLNLPIQPDGKYKYASSKQTGQRRIYVIVYPPQPADIATDIRRKIL